MTFLNPIWLFALPLVFLPIVIHLLNQRRHRTVDWGAMQFLLSAKKMSRGMARLRQWLIMAMRMLAIAGLILIISRPLSSGVIGTLTGGKPETVIILLDRSASMQHQRLQTGKSKLALGREKIAAALKTLGGDLPIVLIDSCHSSPIELSSPQDLLDLPATSQTESETDMPAMMDATLDYISDNQTGRTDVWICSDASNNDWRPESTRWSAIQSGFAQLEGVRFHVLNFAETIEDNLSVQVTRHDRIDSAGKSELVIDLRIERSSSAVGPQTVPVTFNIGGIRSVLDVEIDGETASLNGHRIPIDAELEVGWGQIELPLDSNVSDNHYYFAFAKPSARRTVIVSDNPQPLRPLRLAASTSIDNRIEYQSNVVGVSNISEIDWQSTACIIWQAPLPKDTVAKQLEQFVASGRTVLFLPPDQPTGATFLGLNWKNWRTASGDGQRIGYWNNDTDLFSRTKNGDALPIDDVLVYRYIGLMGKYRVLAKLEDESPLLVRANTNAGGVYCLTTWPVATHSSLSREGISMFAMTHRAIAAGASSLGAAQHFTAGTTPANQTKNLEPIAPSGSTTDVRLTQDHPFRAGVYGNETRLVALNRPIEEDRSTAIAASELAQLFDGLDFQIVDDSLTSNQSLASEIWKLFAVLAGVALILEAWLCMPQRPASQVSSTTATVSHPIERHAA